MTDMVAHITATPPEEHEVVIIGAGFAGLGAGIKLKKAGITDFVILERADSVGGTWRANTYPGVAVDIPSFTYSYHFEPNPDWSRAFAPGIELKNYAEHCADKYGLRAHLRFGCDVVEAVFDEGKHHWLLTLADGSTISGRYLMSCHGVLNTPLQPSIPGLDAFLGHTINTMNWDHDYDLGGKRVAIIGTGATALQVIPSIAPDVAHLDVYQRTPIWVVPKVDPAMHPLVRRIFRTLPVTQKLVRLGTNALTELLLTLAVVYNKDLPALVKAAERGCLSYLQNTVADPVLRQKLTPQYGLGCKRPSFSNSYYQAFLRDNVDLVTDGIETITPTGLRTVDGHERDVDALILATGFKLYDVPYELHGTDGMTLNELWDTDRHQAYQGTSVVGFPNMFLAPGPYGASGASWFSTIDLCLTHAVRVIQATRARGASRVEISRQAHDAFDRQARRRVGRTVFVNPVCNGSNSYYIDQHGDAPFLRPTSGISAWLAQRTFNLDHYEFSITSVQTPLRLSTTSGR